MFETNNLSDIKCTKIKQQSLIKNHWHKFYCDDTCDRKTQKKQLKEKT